MIRYIAVKLFLLSALLFITSPLYSEANIDEGKALFKANCGACHAKDMKSKLTGPPLGGAQERWEDQELLYAWIRNSQQVIASGDQYAVDIYNEWNKTLMNPFPDLTDQQIESILGYIECVYTQTGECAPVTTTDAGTGGEAAAGWFSSGNPWVYLILLLFLGALALVLARIIVSLNQIAAVQDGDAPPAKKSLADILMSKGVIGFVLFALIVLGGYTTVNNAIGLNRQQGYAPEQPIIYSHATHAGLQQIDCQYCHDGARRSKHASIPATNTCMNCHKAVKTGSLYGTAELTKVFASAGYNPNTDQYVDLSQMPEDSIEIMYKKWIGDSYMAKEGLKGLDAKGQNLVEDEWENIVSSLTNEVKKEVYGPIPWVRVHNVPDHVYFNHAQHVTVGEVECQTCHGPVETMEVLGQHAPLSMGWCVNCHRKTDVKFVDNDYYKTYERFHEELKEGKRTSVTVEDIGGLECQKCHY